MTTFTVEIKDPEGQVQRLYRMPRSFMLAVHDWWAQDVDGLTTIRFIQEEEVVDGLLTHH